MSALTASDLDDVGVLGRNWHPTSWDQIHTWPRSQRTWRSWPHPNEVNPKTTHVSYKMLHVLYRTTTKMAAASLLPFKSLTEILLVALETYWGRDSGTYSSAWPRWHFLQSHHSRWRSSALQNIRTEQDLTSRPTILGKVSRWLANIVKNSFLLSCWRQSCCIQSVELCIAQFQSVPFTWFMMWMVPPGAGPSMKSDHTYPQEGAYLWIDSQPIWSIHADFRDSHVLANN